MPEELNIDNLTMRIWLQTLESLVGEGGLHSILNYAHLTKYNHNLPPQNDELEIPADDIRKLVLCLTELFGQKGARVLQLRAGREFIHIGVEETGPVAKALLAAARILPETKRMRLALEKLEEESDKRLPSKDKRIELREEGDCFIYIDRCCLESKGVVSVQPVCNVTAGLLSALMEWITRHPHEVTEIECRALGHPADVFRIEKSRKE